MQRNVKCGLSSRLVGSKQQKELIRGAIDDTVVHAVSYDFRLCTVLSLHIVRALESHHGPPETASERLDPILDWLDDPNVNAQTYFERAGTWGLAKDYGPRNLQRFRQPVQAATEAVEAATEAVQAASAAYADALEEGAEAAQIEELHADLARALEDQLDASIAYSERMTRLERKEQEIASIRALKDTVKEYQGLLDGILPPDDYKAFGWAANSLKGQAVAYQTAFKNNVTVHFFGHQERGFKAHLYAVAGDRPLGRRPYPYRIGHLVRLVNQSRTLAEVAAGLQEVEEEDDRETLCEVIVEHWRVLRGGGAEEDVVVDEGWAGRNVRRTLGYYHFLNGKIRAGLARYNAEVANDPKAPKAPCKLGSIPLAPKTKLGRRHIEINTTALQDLLCHLDGTKKSDKERSWDELLQLEPLPGRDDLRRVKGIKGKFRKWAFDWRIMTDGVSMSVEMVEPGKAVLAGSKKRKQNSSGGAMAASKRKKGGRKKPPDPQPEPPAAPAPGPAMEIRRTGADPGRTSLLTTCPVRMVEEGQPGSELRGRRVLESGPVQALTKSQYRHESLLKASVRHEKRRSQKNQDLTTALNRGDRSGTAAEQLEYLRAVSENYAEVKEKLIRPRRSARLALGIYMERPRCIDRFLRSLHSEETVKEDGKLHLALGDAEFASGGRGEVSVPTVWLRSRMDLHTRGENAWLSIEPVKEYMTTRGCGRCRRTANCEVRVAGESYARRGLKYCPCCQVVMSRDGNAARTMAILSGLDEAERPALFRRPAPVQPGGPPRVARARNPVAEYGVATMRWSKRLATYRVVEVQHGRVNGPPY